MPRSWRRLPPRICSFCTGGIGKALTLAIVSLALPLPSCEVAACAAALPVQPQRRGAIAVVEAVVGGKVLHIRLPGGRDRGGVQVHIVLLLCHIPLNVEDELLTRL